MIDMSAANDGISLLFGDAQAWIVVPIGILIGLVFGAIPGISISVAMAIFLPATLYMDFLPAILFLTAIFTGGGFGGAIPAILMNIPGTSSAVATAFDGYPMAQQGRHSEALGIGLAASVIGTFLGYIALFLIVEFVAEWVLRLGPTEMFVVALWGLTLIALLNTGSFAKGIVAGMIGILIATIGYSDAGQMRGTFGSMYLLDGIPAIPALIGLFAASELFNLIGRDYLVRDESLRTVSMAKIVGGMKDAMRRPLEIFRSSAVGVGIGLVPGVGASIANLAAYGVAKRAAKDPASYGAGNPGGVIASEGANSSSEGASMVSLLALGIPGGAGTAVLLGAFAMHNVTGGPRFISENKDIVYALIFGNMVQAVLLLFIGVVFVRFAGVIVKVPLRILAPLVMVMSVLGAYALTGNMVGPVTVVVAGILGWFMRRYGFPVAATVVGLLVGGMAEGELVRSYQVSGGDLSFVAGRPITLLLIALLVLSLMPRLIVNLSQRGKPAASTGDAS